LQFKVLLKMDNNKYLQDIQDIKQLMNRSSRFLSLSGLSGIMAGIYALISAFIAHRWIIANRNLYFDYETNSAPSNTYLIVKLLVLAGITMILAVTTAFVLTYKRARKNKEKIWDTTTKLLLVHFSIPMLAGGILILMLLNQHLVGIVAPMTLIFYGLALISASKYTLDTVKYLGISEVIVGLIAMQFIGYGLYFWAFGFGVLHIIYGAVMHFKENN